MEKGRKGALVSAQPGKLSNLAEIQLHNLKCELRQAINRNDSRSMAKVSQKIVDSGYELKEIGLSRAEYDHLGHTLVEQDQVPKKRSRA